MASLNMFRSLSLHQLLGKGPIDMLLSSPVAQWVMVGSFSLYAALSKACHTSWIDSIRRMARFAPPLLEASGDQRSETTKCSASLGDTGLSGDAEKAAVAIGLILVGTVAKFLWQAFRPKSNGLPTSDGEPPEDELLALRKETTALHQRIKDLEESLSQRDTVSDEMQSNVNLLVAAVEPLVPCEEGSILFAMERYIRDGPTSIGGLLDDHDDHDGNGNDSLALVSESVLVPVSGGHVLEEMDNFDAEPENELESRSEPMPLQ